MMTWKVITTMKFRREAGVGIRLSPLFKVFVKSGTLYFLLYVVLYIILLSLTPFHRLTGTKWLFRPWQLVKLIPFKVAIAISSAISVRVHNPLVTTYQPWVVFLSHKYNTKKLNVMQMVTRYLFLRCKSFLLPHFKMWSDLLNLGPKTDPRHPKGQPSGRSIYYPQWSSFRGTIAKGEKWGSEVQWGVHREHWQC